MKQKVLLLFVLLAIINSLCLSLFYGGYISRQLNQMREVDRQQLADQVEQRLELLGSLIPIMENQAREMVAQAMSEIYGTLTSQKSSPAEWTNEDFQAVISDYPMGELYWIDGDNVVTITTFSADQGLDLGSLSDDFNLFLDQVRQSGEFLIPHFSFSNMTGRLMMYGYFSPPGSDGILEYSLDMAQHLAAVSSSEGEPFSPRVLFEFLRQEDEYLVEVDFFSLTGVASWSMIDGERVSLPEGVDLDSLLEQRIIVQESKGLIHTYRLITRITDSDLFSDNFCLKTVYDQRHHREIQNRLIFWGALVSLGVTLFFALLLAFLVDRYLIRYILTLHQALQSSLGGQYQHRLSENQNLREFREISYAYNRLMISTDSREKALSDQSRQLESALEQRDALLRELHHRVKNNLQIICSLVAMEESKLDLKGQRVLQEIAGRVGAMSAVHELLYGNDELAEVPLEELVCRVAERVVGLNLTPEGGLRWETAGLEGHLSLETAVPLALLVSEVFINSITHGSAAGQELVFRIEGWDHQDGTWHLLMRDNGKGFSSLERDNDGLGLMLIRSLAEQLGGELRLTNQEGAQVELILPAALVLRD